jgi:3-oxoacyl-(acyl-carrier-protein) synthase
MNVYITGMGIISAIGDNVAETAASLAANKTGIAPIQLLQTRYNPEYVAGEVKHSNDELVKMAGVSTDTITRTTLLGVIAIREAMTQAGILEEDNKNTALVSATTVAGIVKTEAHFKDFLDRVNKVNFIDTHDNGYQAEFMSEFFGLSDFITTINTACSSSANSIIMGARLIKSGMFDRVIAGGTDAFCKYTLNGFNSLMLIDKEPCKPFDKNRKGINLGEGAGYLVLESEAAMKARGGKPLCRLSGYAVTNDAFHQTSISPEGYGVQLAMKKSLEMAGLEEKDISYINAHGTGTNNNDNTEGMAISILFKDKIPPFSSTKSFTGHTLAASGSIEAIISALAIREGMVYGNLNFTTPIEVHNLQPVPAATSHNNMEHVLSNSIGIGGFCSTVIISKN